MGGTHRERVAKVKDGMFLLIREDKRLSEEVRFRQGKEKDTDLNGSQLRLYPSLSLERIIVSLVL